MNIKRINELSIGDICIKFCNEWILYNDDGVTKKFKRNIPELSNRNKIFEVGSKSKEKVEYLGVYTFQRTRKYKIEVYDWETRNFIGTYNNAIEASKELGVTPSHISDYFGKNFKNKNFNLGYHFEKNYTP